jgi:hypothetical protein
MCGTTIELLSSHRGIVCPLAVALRIALGVVVCGNWTPPQDVLCSPSTPERQSLFESHRQRRWLTIWSYYTQIGVLSNCTPHVQGDGLNHTIFAQEENRAIV